MIPYVWYAHLAFDPKGGHPPHGTSDRLADRTTRADLAVLVGHARRQFGVHLRTRRHRRCRQSTGRHPRPTRNCIEGCRAVLEAAGSGLQHVLKVTVFLTDMKEFAAMNEVYRAAFPASALPARSTVEVSALARPDLRVEIEMTGCIP